MLNRLTNQVLQTEREVGRERERAAFLFFKMSRDGVVVSIDQRLQCGSSRLVSLIVYVILISLFSAASD